MEDHQNSPETTIKQPKLQTKTLEAIRLVQNGADYQTALQITNNKPIISERAIYKLKDKCKKYTLTNPKMVKLAHSALKDCLSDKTIAGSEIKPTWSNKIAASAMIYDRFEPVIHQQININAEFSPVDLSKYFNGSKPEPVKLGDIEV